MSKKKTDAAAPAVTHAHAGSPDQTEKAFDAMKSRLAEVSSASFVQINLDVAAGAAKVLGLAPHLKTLLPQVKLLPDFDPHHVEHIDQYALAAWHTQLEYDKQGSPELLKRLAAEGTELRGLLLDEADPLVRRKKLAADTVATLHAKGNGHLEVAECLIGLAKLFRDAPVRGGVTQEEIDHAASLGPALAAAHGAQQVGQARDAGATDWADQRARAFTLWMTAYNQCRRAAAYLRFSHGDADQYAPSLLGHVAPAHPTAPANPAPVPPPPVAPAPGIPAKP